MASLYDAENHISSDSCALRAKDEANRQLLDYHTNQMRIAGCDTSQTCHPVVLSSTQRNLRAWDGFSFGPCMVDADSQLRVRSEVTHPRQRMQLPKRIFDANPDLSRGQAAADVEVDMVSGHSTTMHRVCDKLAEKDFDRFDPGVHHVTAEHIIPTWTRGGAPSRAIAKTSQFLEGMGYFHDGRTWRRA